MTTETLLLLVVIILLIGAFPAWPHSRPWGYGPSGILGVILIVFLIWAVTQNRPLFRSAGDDIGSAVHEAGHDLKDMGRDAADTIRDTVK